MTNDIESEKLVVELKESLENLNNAEGEEADKVRSHILSTVVCLLESHHCEKELFELAPQFSRCGVFGGSDWDHPDTLQPSLVRGSLTGDPMTAAIEVLSELRFLAIVTGDLENENVTKELARAFLEDVLAQNLDLLFPESTELVRERWTVLLTGIHRIFELLSSYLGTNSLLPRLIDEAGLMLEQRPIMVNRVTSMLGAAERGLVQANDKDLANRTRQLSDAWHGPSPLSMGIDSPEQYQSVIAGLSAEALRQEAEIFGISMRQTGLVCPLHAVLLRYINDLGSKHLLEKALALDVVGKGGLDAYFELCTRLVDVAIYPATAQSIYGLAEMLDRGVLFFPPVAPGLWRLIDLEILEDVARALQDSVSGALLPCAAAVLVSGAISILGQPLGVGQGNNPTCQSARAISLWAQCDPGYLLELVTNAARDGFIDMHFEGALLRSSDLQPGLVDELHTELDPVSLVLVPHLDRVYVAMGNRVAGRDQDGHRWINPEFHGWWVFRGFSTVLQFQTCDIIDYEGFMRRFFAAYHPAYNNGRLMIYPQPAGIASTDPQGNLIGWHAVTILRVTIDAAQSIRVYFFDPNNEGRQDWGQGIVTSICNNGEFPGESSLTFEQFAARIYLFHYHPSELGDMQAVEGDLVDSVAKNARASWASQMIWHAVVPT